jgi:hypothetical protein
MDVPEDLGQRIIEATRLAVALHLQQSQLSERKHFLEINHPGGTGVSDGGAIIPIGRADPYGPDATDGAFEADPVTAFGGRASSLLSGADCEAA